MSYNYFITDENFYGQNGTHTPGKWCIGTVCGCGAVPARRDFPMVDFDTKEECVEYARENKVQVKELA